MCLMNAFGVCIADVLGTFEELGHKLESQTYAQGCHSSHQAPYKHPLFVALKFFCTSVSHQESYDLYGLELLCLESLY